jgi:hypothetical protein
MSDNWSVVRDGDLPEFYAQEKQRILDELVRVKERLRLVEQELQEVYLQQTAVNQRSNGCG